MRRAAQYRPGRTCRSGMSLALLPLRAGVALPYVRFASAMLRTSASESGRGARAAGWRGGSGRGMFTPRDEP